MHLRPEEKYSRIFPPRQGQTTIRWESAASGPGPARCGEGAGASLARARPVPRGRFSVRLSIWFSKGEFASASLVPGSPESSVCSHKAAPSGRCARGDCRAPAAGAHRFLRSSPACPQTTALSPEGSLVRSVPRLPCKMTPEQSSRHPVPQAPGPAAARARNANAGRRNPTPLPFRTPFA